MGREMKSFSWGFGLFLDVQARCIGLIWDVDGWWESFVDWLPFKQGIREPFKNSRERMGVGLSNFLERRTEQEYS